MPLQMLSDMSQLQALQGALEAMLRGVMLVPVQTFGLLALACLLQGAVRRVRAGQAGMVQQAAAVRPVIGSVVSPRAASR